MTKHAYGKERRKKVNKSYGMMISLYAFFSAIVCIFDILLSRLSKEYYVISVVELMALSIIVLLAKHVEKSNYSLKIVKRDVAISTIMFVVAGYSVILRRLFAIGQPYYYLIILLLPTIFMGALGYLFYYISKRRSEKKKEVKFVDSTVLIALIIIVVIIMSKYISPIKDDSFSLILILLTLFFEGMSIFFFAIFEVGMRHIS